MSRTLFSWTLHAIVYFWLIPAYIAFYTMVPRAAGGRLYSDTMGRLTFILFLIYSLPVGMHHLLMDPEHGNATKFIQVLLTAFVAVPTLLTIFTITASLEIAGRLRGGRGVFGWIAALPWERPMVLATGLGFVMLGFGGFGGIINMGYGMNAMVHNTSWVTAHFHLIFGGSVVIMYFAIAYEIWPRLTGRDHASLAPLRLQLWLWFIGMMVMTLPWHWLGLQGQWRRVANFNYADPIIAGWGPWVVVSFVGGIILLVSAMLFVWNLAVLHRSTAWAVAPPALCAGRPSAAARAGRAQRVRPVERAGAGADGPGLRLSDRPVPDRAVAVRRSCTGCDRTPCQTSPRPPIRMSSTSHGGSGRPWPCMGILLGRHPARRAWSFRLFRAGAPGSMPTRRSAGRSESFRVRRRSRSLRTGRPRRRSRR